MAAVVEFAKFVQGNTFSQVWSVSVGGYIQYTRAF